MRILLDRPAVLLGCCVILAPDRLTCGVRPESHPGQGAGPRPRSAGCEPTPGHQGAAGEDEARRRIARLAGERFHTSRPPAAGGERDGVRPSE